MTDSDSHLMVANVVAEAAGEGLLRAYSLDAPRPGDDAEGDFLTLDGWAIGRDASPVAVEIDDGTGVRWRAPVDGDRPDVAAAFTEVPGAAASGFRLQLSLARIGPGSRTRLSAIWPDDRRAPFATIRFGRAGESDPPDLAPTPVVSWPDLVAETSRDVAGPDFVIIGTQRGGTTSLHRYLGGHPQIALPARKELHYFSRFYNRGPGWYRGQFPTRLPPGTITGEATPYYLFHPHAPRRLRAHAPGAKLIVLLRDPVDRAYSHYHHERRRGHELLPFEEALGREEQRLRGEVDRMLADEGYDSPAHRHHSYQARGRYAEQLRAWFAFFPREQFLILQSEALYRDPAGTVRAVTDFLVLPPDELRDRRVNHDAPYPQMAPETRGWLQAAFVASTHELSDLLGRDLAWPDGYGAYG